MLNANCTVVREFVEKMYFATQRSNPLNPMQHGFFFVTHVQGSFIMERCLGNVLAQRASRWSWVWLTSGQYTMLRGRVFMGVLNQNATKNFICMLFKK